MSDKDREILELAAKAASIPVTPDCHIPSGGIWLPNVDVDRVWSPLTDDGDALRLAALLKMDVLQDSESVSVKRYRGAAFETEYLAQEQVAECRFKATRRAIVIAAAEIGRAMP